jgi:hypothetical protein
MKKKLMGLALVAAFVIVGFAPVTHAIDTGTPPQTDVTGVITKSGVAVAGANVQVTCMGNVETDSMTDAAGSYLVVFSATDCPSGSTVSVVAEKDGESGTASGTANGLTTKLNVAIVNVSIPEYGLIGAILAGGAGIGAIAFARRRSTGSGMAV